MALSIGQNIAAARGLRRVSQARLSKLIGRSQQAISVWERGEAAPRAEDIVTIAKVLNIPVPILVGHDPVKILAIPVTSKEFITVPLLASVNVMEYQRFAPENLVGSVPYVGTDEDMPKDLFAWQNPGSVNLYYCSFDEKPDTEPLTSLIRSGRDILICEGFDRSLKVLAWVWAQFTKF